MCLSAFSSRCFRLSCCESECAFFTKLASLLQTAFIFWFFLYFLFNSFLFCVLLLFCSLSVCICLMCLFLFLIPLLFVTFPFFPLFILRIFLQYFVFFFVSVPFFTYFKFCVGFELISPMQVGCGFLRWHIVIRWELIYRRTLLPSFHSHGPSLNPPSSNPNLFVMFDEGCKVCSFSLWNIRNSPVFSSLLKSKCCRPVLEHFQSTFPSVRDHVSHPCGLHST